MVECLPDFAVVAEERSLPMVLGIWKGAELDIFMGKGATYENGTFTFGMKYRDQTPLPMRVYFPSGEPASVTLAGVAVPFVYDSVHTIVEFRLPPAKEYRVVRAEIEGMRP